LERALLLRSPCLRFVGHIEEKKEVVGLDGLLIVPNVVKTLLTAKYPFLVDRSMLSHGLGVSLIFRMKELPWNVPTARKLQFISVISCGIGRFSTPGALQSHLPS
jgi:hypothetical protein